MPDPSPEQPPSWPPTSEPAATPTNPPRITARGVGHLPSTAPDDEPSAAERFLRPPQQTGPYEELDPEARRSEWGAFDDATPGVPQQSGPQYGNAPYGEAQYGEAQHGQPQRDEAQYGQTPQRGAPDPVYPESDYQGFQEQSQQEPPRQDAAQQGDWGEAPDWPPKSSQDWMHQQSQTGWGLTGGASWNGTGEAPPPAAAPEAPAEPQYQPEQGGSPFGAAPQAPGFDPPTYDAPRQPAQGEGLEFPELRSDPYEADVYGHNQYRGEAGGQDLYQSDPYQAERLQAEAQQARAEYQAQQQAEPFPPVPQQGSYGEPRNGATFGSGSDAFGPTGAATAEPAQQQPFSSQQDPYAAPPSAYGDQSSYNDQTFPESAYADQGSQQAAAPEAVPAQRTGEETEQPEAPAEPAGNVRVAPPTHRGVRYAIYGIGGLITLGLIIGIVLMLGAAPPEEPSEPGEDGGDASEDSGADDALTPERYGELAAAAGTAEWFSWRYGEAGENGAEELAAASGDALAAEPLFGDADRSIQGQLGYVTDESGLTGIDHVTVVESTDTALGLTPRAGGRFTDEGQPELELQEGTTADCVAGLGGELGKPVALARPEQSAEVNAHSVIAFSSGVIATAGISGAQGGTCLQLPDGQVPTDVALTDGNELALVTTWTPESQTGSLVVIALGDKKGTYQSSWSESYPGLPNPGHFGTAEIVGTVVLPFTAPTSVDAWSNSGGSLSESRNDVADGAGRDQVATAGYAIVGDLSSSQVATVDLASTLEGLAAQHYDGAEFTFEAAAGEAVGFDGGVADVAATESASAVATADGTVHELDGSLKETAATEVGANPTCLVVGAQSGAFIATSRGEAKVSWVSGGKVEKELADSRMSDPLCASETPALNAKGYDGTAAMVLVSDYTGQKLHSYLDGQATIPGGATVGDDGFSYAGAYEVAGNPWGASVTVDLE
ncbi:MULTISPECIES: hypothetical protein [Glycomyces]|uniref:Uncharacterized protein n=1 Tax=Glycomyces lechevalierae TaxID=256034 RepID=A0A9X3PIH2_9ACTN|nr:hypothetical protein [Glycomyces lechevalierae]MDA1385870.1 hypothetical protein [Glycomyces lechevalierae]MDR7339991.1 hypothetical protein [Glycomyces lechevalierae]